MRTALLWLCRISFFGLMMFSAFMAAGWGGVLVIGVGLTSFFGMIWLDK